MLHWGEENKTRLIDKNNSNKEFGLPEQWKKDFKWATKLDMLLFDGDIKTLSKNEMKMCNKLYRYYGSVYDTI